MANYHSLAVPVCYAWLGIYLIDKDQKNIKLYHILKTPFN